VTNCRISFRNLTAHRTLGLRLALGDQSEVAIAAVTDALAAQTFYRGAEAHVLDIHPGPHQRSGLFCVLRNGGKTPAAP
jgi:ParB family chromosome partitioning protein